MTLDDIRTRLRTRKIPLVAQEVGLSKQTIYTLMRDGAAKPHSGTLKLLSDYLEANA